MAAALDVVKNDIVFLVGEGINAAELSVKIKGVFGNDLFLAVKLIVKVADVRTDIFNLNTEASEIRHFEITVKSIGRINANGQAVYLLEIVVVSACEKVG